ncbi:MAG: hypothetical protein LCH70_08795 [Proteobacteria bacterium]|nr:hypothetical protein [Pseudomonadota bacterium]
MNLRLFFTTIFLLLCAPFAKAQSMQSDYRLIEQRLSVEQMRSTGLDKLSKAQLELLNRLLSEEHVAQTAAIRQEVEAKAEQERSSTPRIDREPIVSKLVGEFRGWTVGTQFQLENGQRWRVTGTTDYYVRKVNASMAPAAVVMPGMVGGWYLKVEGHSPTVKVQQIR